jgi:hypothetical protein
MRPAIAAETLIFKYQIFQAEVSTDELTELAETGEAPHRLEQQLNMAGADTEQVRGYLTREFPVSLVTLDWVLNTSLGENALDRVGEAIHPESDTANREALRSALVLSASDDNQITLLEVLQNYPTNEVYIDVETLVDAYRHLQGISDQLEELSDWLEGLES